MQIELDDIKKSYGPMQVLRGASLSIPACKSLMFIGPSGSGKSTILRVIAGLVVPDSGHVTLNGMVIPTDEKELLDYRRSLGTVFQSWNLFPHLTALENVSLPLYRVHGLSRKEAYQRAMELLTRFGLQDHASKYPGELSGGQSQRVAIVRAVAIQPRVLLFDEPTSALDPAMTSEVLDLIAELKEGGSDFILVSHHMTFARRIADYIAFVKEGKIIEVGETKSFFESPQTIDAKNFLDKVLKY